jgi:hypothetical protein
MSEWTAGPWFAATDGSGLIVSIDGVAINNIPYCIYERDAQLIAAAPELYKALFMILESANEEGLEFIGHSDNVINARNALVKATGGQIKPLPEPPNA